MWFENIWGISCSYFLKPIAKLGFWRWRIILVDHDGEDFELFESLDVLSASLFKEYGVYIKNA